MAGNRFGHIFQYQTWGESHGPAIGCIVDGVPPKIPLKESDIQEYLDKRKPGNSKYTSQRKESDTVIIQSGVFEGVTTGTPIHLLIVNQDQRSKDYCDIKNHFRPGHADYVYQEKYGVRDYRGGGRASARETAMRVAAGAIARKVLSHHSDHKITIQGALVQIGRESVSQDRWSWKQCNKNDFWCPDSEIVEVWENMLKKSRKQGSSIGAVIEIHAKNVPPGLGEPVYDKLDADLAKAIMSINAVKAVEIGDGFSVASLKGEDNADHMYKNENGNIAFLSNHAGGIVGGISTGQDIIVRFAVKPTSSILKPQKSVNIEGEDTEVITKGRHDPCVGIRAVPVGEAMVACVLADHLLRYKAIS